MLKLSQLLDAKRRESSDTNSDFSPQSRQPPQSPLSADSSTPVSPVVSLFSSKSHTRVSSSVSSLVSSSEVKNSLDSSSRNQLTGVQEEPCQAKDLEEEYFQHFDQDMSDVHDAYFATVDYSDAYDLTDAGTDIPHSPKKRRAESISGKGLSRISSRISTISSRWRSSNNRLADGPDAMDTFGTSLRSRTNSTSSFRGSSTISRVDSIAIPPSPARTIFEERLSESGAQPIDIAKANSQYAPEEEAEHPQATTPLLPPFMGDEPLSMTASRVQSPLQSPSVADVSEESLENSMTISDLRLAGIPSPPLSSKPSVASFHHRPRASTMRTVSGEGPPPFMLTDPKDEWANKLGHANFTVQPEPYVPEVYDLAAFRQFREQWDLAQCHFAKHLVRTGEHYGVTSTIFQLTEAKWESINSEWKRTYEAMLSQLKEMDGSLMGIIKSHGDPCEQVKIPRLHVDKFPELGDGEIVGPMKIAPAVNIPTPCRTRSLKRSFFKFFQDLVSRS
ncbi:uncharacterized protein ACLA_088590 [Aspergillus clavatus NRRL 1]|uniref:Only prolin and serin are matching in the corresponding protein n=1 Tax=Aspergillus clavatus (strain ATCC 1007 / CBS 513.65 / DSM 816 / NCTC 3887 / NRRL 1 / QM 1276 / 107) TaxID=344612 RepID=A1CE71_ASPCL|nr:uncharacterized protein ACLA_088590 [Aspergillus clavatus NRRL 1]EAW11170.1 conserved hypothetical protein [Aspergillus clavatus NRRL 1]